MSAATNRPHCTRRIDARERKRASGGPWANYFLDDLATDLMISAMPALTPNSTNTEIQTPMSASVMAPKAPISAAKAGTVIRKCHQRSKVNRQSRATAPMNSRHAAMSSRFGRLANVRTHDEVRAGGVMITGGS
jgi:hypothetical protein